MQDVPQMTGELHSQAGACLITIMHISKHRMHEEQGFVNLVFCLLNYFTKKLSTRHYDTLE